MIKTCFFVFKISEILILRSACKVTMSLFLFFFNAFRLNDICDLRRTQESGAEFRKKKRKENSKTQQSCVGVQDRTYGPS